MTPRVRMSSSTSMPPRASGMSSRGSASPGSCAKIRVTKIRPAPRPRHGRRGTKIAGADYIGALEKVSELRRLCAELFERVDLVLTPTAAALPWAAERPIPIRIAGRPAGPRDHADLHRVGEHIRRSGHQPADRRFRVRAADRSAACRRLRRRRFPAGLRARGLARHSSAAPPAALRLAVLSTCVGACLTSSLDKISPGIFRSSQRPIKPATSKVSSIEGRVKGGRLPRKGVMVEESSGGAAASRPAGSAAPLERAIVSQIMRLTYRESVDRDRPIFILNAFALGAWAREWNVSLSR